ANFADPALPYHLSMINRGSNDYQRATVPTGDAAADRAVIEAARQASLGYLYSLQTEGPPDHTPNQVGVPELKPRYGPFMAPPRVASPTRDPVRHSFGPTDGTAPLPSIRESRRIRAIKTIAQHDVAANFNPGSRAKLCTDPCGIGHYGATDLHALRAVGMPPL